MALETRESRPMTRLNNCDACGHYNWACTCEGAAAYHGSGEPVGGDILRGKQGLASCLLLGVVRIYHKLCYVVMRNFA